MSQSQYSGSKGFRATAALGKGIAVKLSSGEVVVATAGTDKIVGVTENSCEAGEVVSVRLRSGAGTIKVKLAGNVSVGAFVTATTAGELIATTTAANEIVGQALESGVDGDLIEVMLSTGHVPA